MAEPVDVRVTRKQKPMILDEEVQQLAKKYGAPVRCTFRVQADERIRTHRWRANSDRRAEVVFALEDPMGRVWLHNKSHYPSHLYRLPSGGIEWEEAVEDALLREVEEETSLAVEIERFVGLIHYHFYHNGTTAQFASYVFHLRTGSGAPQAHGEENIAGFQAVLPRQIAQTAADLRNLIGDRRAWGQWRALSHDLVYEYLTR